MDVITIDGSQGEGGGQVLRTALTLSLVTGRPFRIERIRAGRKKPGLLRQHLTAVQAAGEVGGATVTGAELGSLQLEFEPGSVRGGDYHFAVGTAGSATLVLQTVLVPLALAKSPSRLVLEGGTHNPFAPPFDFLDKTFLPAFRRMGAGVTARLERPGFYPAGGGRFSVEVEPCRGLTPIELERRAETVTVTARAIVASLPASIAERELATVRERLAVPAESCRIEQVTCSVGPGNALMLELAADDLVEVVTGFGEKGVSAEQVAARACGQAKVWMRAGVPVGAHLADQLLVPMAVAGRGRFRTVEPSGHTKTNAEVIKRFLPVGVTIDDEGNGAWTIEITRKTGARPPAPDAPRNR
jgi:RNA 3'-terminal phosphate cyclase (ATP)